MQLIQKNILALYVVLAFINWELVLGFSLHPKSQVIGKGESVSSDQNLQTGSNGQAKLFNGFKITQEAPSSDTKFSNFNEMIRIRRSFGHQDPYGANGLTGEQREYFMKLLSILAQQNSRQKTVLSETGPCSHLQNQEDDEDDFIDDDKSIEIGYYGSRSPKSRNIHKRNLYSACEDGLEMEEKKIIEAGKMMEPQNKRGYYFLSYPTRKFYDTFRGFNTHFPTSSYGQFRK